MLLFTLRSQSLPQLYEELGSLLPVGLHHLLFLDTLKKWLSILCVCHCRATDVRGLCPDRYLRTKLISVNETQFKFDLECFEYV